MEHGDGEPPAEAREGLERNRQQLVELRKLAAILRRDAISQRAYAGDLRRSNASRIASRDGRRRATAERARRPAPGGGSGSDSAAAVSGVLSANHDRYADAVHQLADDWRRFAAAVRPGHYAQRASDAHRRARDAGERARRAETSARDAFDRAIAAQEQFDGDAGTDPPAAPSATA